MILRFKNSLLIIFILLPICSPVFAVEKPYRLTDEMYYRVDTIYHVRNDSPSNAEKITLELPLVNEHLTRNLPYSQLLCSSFSLALEQEIIDDRGNCKGRLLIAKLRPGEQQDIRMTQVYRVALINYEIDPASVGEYGPFIRILTPYLTPSPGIECEDPELVKKAKEITTGETNPFLKAKKVFAFLQSHMRYASEKNDPINQGALSALKTGVGVCEDYADLMVALLRASGVPARTVTGWMGKVDSRVVTADLTGIKLPGHIWVEYYLPKYGWVPSDPTYVFLLNGVSTVDYNRLTGIKELRYAENTEPGENAIRYSYYGDKVTVTREVSITGDTTITNGVCEYERILLYLEGIPLIFDVDPLIVEGRTLVPLRGIAAALGAQVEWDGAERQITIKSAGKTILLKIGNNSALVDGEEITLDTWARIVNNRTLVPLRFIGETLGVSVHWDGNKKMIELECPDQ